MTEKEKKRERERKKGEERKCERDHNMHNYPVPMLPINSIPSYAHAAVTEPRV